MSRLLWWRCDLYAALASSVNSYANTYTLAGKKCGVCVSLCYFSFALLHFFYGLLIFGAIHLAGTMRRRRLSLPSLCEVADQNYPGDSLGIMGLNLVVEYEMSRNTDSDSICESDIL